MQNQFPMEMVGICQMMMTNINSIGIALMERNYVRMKIISNLSIRSLKINLDCHLMN
jgi:hypothetical protein